MCSTHIHYHENLCLGVFKLLFSFFQCGLPGNLHVPRRNTTKEPIYGALGVMEAESEKHSLIMETRAVSLVRT